MAAMPASEFEWDQWKVILSPRTRWESTLRLAVEGAATSHVYLGIMRIKMGNGLSNLMVKGESCTRQDETNSWLVVEVADEGSWFKNTDESWKWAEVNNIKSDETWSKIGKLSYRIIVAKRAREFTLVYCFFQILSCVDSRHRLLRSMKYFAAVSQPLCLWYIHWHITLLWHATNAVGNARFTPDMLGYRMKS